MLTGMKIVHVSSEQHPFIKTGGLADVVESLSRHTAKQGHEVISFLPLYRTIRESEWFAKAQRRHSTFIQLGDEAYEGEVYRLKLGRRLDLYLIGRDEFFDRSYPYGTKHRDYSDNDARFIFYCKAVVDTLLRENVHADILHCHDWQSALVPIFARVEEAYKGMQVGTRSLLTIHNLAFQGVFPDRAFDLTNLPSAFFGIDGLEYYGQVNFLKSGILFADGITTVSPNYAKEILLPEFGCGLEGVLQKRQSELHAILNGIDTRAWNPRTDIHLPAHYSVRSLDRKRENKEALLNKVDLPVRPGAPLYGLVSRLTDQKGIDFILKQKSFWAKNDVQLVALGKGDPKLERGLKRLGKKLPRKVHACFDHDEALSHLIQAGADFFLIPSRFEPCGLNQMYSQRYGTLPMVSRVGGLADTVVDALADPEAGTGIVFSPNETGLRKGLEQSLKLYADAKRFRKIQRKAMARDFSWKLSARDYENLYTELLFGDSQSFSP